MMVGMRDVVILGRFVFVLALILLPGCQKTLPTAPSELSTGITVFEHANYLGRSAHITTDIQNLSDFKGPCEHSDTDSNGNSSSSFDWNDCISSVRVAPGWRVTLYEDTRYRDDEVTSTEDMSNLQLVNAGCSKGGLNDCVSSVRVGRQ